VEILLVEDSPGDVRLIREALKENKIINTLNVVDDGVKAMAFLRKKGEYAKKPRPDVILLDLNLPKMDGRDVLAAIKQDEDLKRIPVVILTTSNSDKDILNAYNLHANCYITKPLDMDQFVHVVQTLKEFWFTIVKLPSNRNA
jgi:chemotaxis family two-component system response regulator Rcp1